VGFQGFKVTRFQGYRFKVFKETRIRVKVSPWTSVKIWILKIGLLKDLLNGGCDSTHLHYHLKEIPQILKHNYHQYVDITCVGHGGHMVPPRSPIDF